MTKQNTTQRPTAIILINQLVESELQTIFGQTETSSLLIAGQSLLTHTLIELRDLDFQQVIILTKHNSQRIQRLLGNTQRWPMSINVMQYHLDKNQLLSNYKSLSEPNGLLIIEMNRFRAHCIKGFLDKSAESEYLLVDAFSENINIGITLLKATESSFIINAMPIELNTIKTSKLSTLHDYHQANFDVIAGKYIGLEPSVNKNKKNGYRQHWSSLIHKESFINSHTSMVDRDCHVGKQTDLNSTILNHNVFIEKNASLENTIVMPNTIIAKNHNLKNAIINNGTVYTV